MHILAPIATSPRQWQPTNQIPSPLLPAHASSSVALHGQVDGCHHETSVVVSVIKLIVAAMVQVRLAAAEASSPLVALHGLVKGRFCVAAAAAAAVLSVIIKHPLSVESVRHKHLKHTL
eukprot:1160826-Pelagomonas_calceolata.AAC.5